MVFLGIDRIDLVTQFFFEIGRVSSTFTHREAAASGEMARKAFQPQRNRD
jgi:hypothetical protein